MIKGLPQKLQQLRLQYGLSQKSVANQLGISPSIISGYETGERTPSTEILLSLSHLYKCSTDYLLGKEPAEPTITLDVSELSDEQIKALQVIIKAMKA